MANPDAHKLFDVVIYHQDCPDGQLSSWIYKKFIQSHYPDHQYDCIGMTAGAFVDIDYNDKTVLLVDVCFKKSKILEVSTKCRYMLILDHHKSAENDISGRLPSNVKTIFDMQRCGAQIAYDYFIGGQRPLYVDLVGDRDLWKFEHPETKSFFAYMSTRTLYRDEGFDQISKLDSLNDIIQIGNYYLEYMDNQIDQLAQKYIKSVLEVGEQEYSVFLATCPLALTSDLGNRLYSNPECEIAIIYQYDPVHDMWNYSCRTNKSYVDLSKITPLFGGGGHPCAAGFKTQGIESFRQLFKKFE